MTTFIVHYTPEQTQDPQVGPDEVFATAAAAHGLTIVWRPSALGQGAVEFEVTGQHEPAEVEHLLKRLGRHNLRVTDADGNEVAP